MELRLKNKILEQTVCMFCLGENSELFKIYDEVGENRIKPEILIKKFEIIEVKSFKLLILKILDLPSSLPFMISDKRKSRFKDCL